MQKREVEKIVHHEPFVPFRLVLVDGEEIVVRRARKALVSGPEIALVGQCRRNGGPSHEKFRIVPINKVHSLEFMAKLAP